jgi:dienelactone hydrolase
MPIDIRVLTRQLLVGLMMVLSCPLAAAQETITRQPPAQPATAQPATVSWDLAALSTVPRTYPASEFTTPEVTALFYEGPKFQGRSTRVFAYYGVPKMPAGQKAPAMVLVHGGGGTAFDRWVKLWNSRGYAAISMDLCGCLPVRETPKKWKRHSDGGPPGWGGFEQTDQPAEDQWTYQAVSDILLGHSLLRSFPEVDAERIGVTGISWGGYLTSIVSGVDSRFRFAAPVYGCGYLGDNSTWLPIFASMKPEIRQQWLAWWDPSVRLGQAHMPILWVNGTNDFAYPMDSWQKSYRTAPGPHTLCLRVRMPHGHGAAGENPAEIQAFADSILQQGVPLAKIAGQGRDGGQAWATFESASPIVRAELNFTLDTGKWQDRVWKTEPAKLESTQHRVSAKLPEGTKVYYFNLIDSRDLVVSTEHEVLAGR